jgi:hypothetical protein
MNTMVVTHGAYLLIGIAATIWVIWTLQRRGRPFLIRTLGGDEALANSWSHLVAVGMYLLHVGCLLLALRYGSGATGGVEAIELLSTKIGLVLMALALTHFLHIKAFWDMRHPVKRAAAQVIDAEVVS